MDQWIRCSTAGSTFALSTSTRLRQIINLISAFYCGRSTLPLVFHHGKEKKQRKKRLWHIQGSYVGYSGAATL